MKEIIAAPQRGQFRSNLMGDYSGLGEQTIVMRVPSIQISGACSASGIGVYPMPAEFTATIKKCFAAPDPDTQT